MSNKANLDAAKGGQRLWSRVSLVLIVGAVFVILAVRQASELSRERDSYAYLIRTNHWIVSQIEFELLRFFSTLDRYALGDAKVSRDELLLRYEILWSRIPVFLNGPEAAQARAVPNAVADVSALMTELETLEPSVMQLRPGDHEAHRAIREALERHEPAVRELVRELGAGAEYQALVDRIVSGQDARLQLQFGILIAGAVVVIFLLMELWRGHRLTLRESNARWHAELANRTKSQFLANMSHELRTPLNAIIGFSEILKEETFGPVGAPQYKTYAEDIHHSAQHLLQILGDILDMAKVEAGGVTLHEELFDPVASVQDAARMVSMEATRKSLDFECRIDQDLVDRIQMHGDARLFRQVAVNLLANAIKFTDPGGQVVISLSMDGEHLLLQVSDSGIGIRQEELAQVTEPFFRVGGAFDSRHEGTGLGLALVKSFVELHEGFVDLDSALGQGTTVSVRFPAKRLVEGVVPANESAA